VGSTLTLNLIGGIALLLWGLHMIHNGMVRSYSTELRRLTGVALPHRVHAFFAGVMVTSLQQNRAATG